VPSRDFPLIPPQASTQAGPIDALFWAINAVTFVFSALIFVAIIFFSVRYRRGTKVDRSNPPQYNDYLELAWTFLPLGLLMGIFVWGTWLFLVNRRTPAGATEIYVVGKQWMWKLQHPTGRWENNELHIPVGRPILLTMTSEDVIHSFFVPAFRVKEDVIPGQYTHMWFQATKVGVYPLFCAEFCGTLHSKMTGTVHVMEPADYQQWLTTGKAAGTMAAAGEKLFRQFGCSGCHGANSSVRAPRLEGIYGKPIAVQIPKPGVPLEKIEAQTILADPRYLHDAIVLPEKEVAAGYRPIMPTFKNRLTEREILDLIAYIRSLSNAVPGEAERAGQSPALSEEDYRARTGFVPQNIKNLTAGTADRGGAANLESPLRRSSGVMGGDKE
jgi:cytochrome c oxidase subunit 2